MATLTVVEGSEALRVKEGYLQVMKMPPVTVQSLAIGSLNVSNAFTSTTTIIRVFADVACNIAIGDNPDAESSTEAFPLTVGQTEYFGVNPGAKIAVIGT